jgi:hypothetical protein
MDWYILADKWTEIYKERYFKLRAEGHTEDQATAMAGKYAYEECDKLATIGNRHDQRKKK